MDYRKLAEIDSKMNTSENSEVTNIKTLISYISQAEKYASTLGFEDISTKLEEAKISVFNDYLAPLKGGNLNSPSEVLGD